MSPSGRRAMRSEDAGGGPRYFLSVRIQATSAFTSSSGTAAFGGIGTWPQTPEPPVLTFCASLADASLSSLYFAATSWYAGPTIFLSTAWQAAQPSFCIIAVPEAISSDAPALLAGAAGAGAAGAAACWAAGAGAAAGDGAAAGAGAAGAGGSVNVAPDLLAMKTTAR